MLYVTQGRRSSRDHVTHGEDLYIVFCTVFYPTLLHPGVKAPGTAKRIPFFPANNSLMLTFVPGLPSCNSTEGRVSPTCVCACVCEREGGDASQTPSTFSAPMLVNEYLDRHSQSCGSGNTPPKDHLQGNSEHNSTRARVMTSPRSSRSHTGVRLRTSCDL